MYLMSFIESHKKAKILCCMRAVLYGTISLLGSALIVYNSNFTRPAIGLLSIYNIFFSWSFHRDVKTSFLC